MIDVPLVGAYYWLPRPQADGVSWELVTCHDLDAWDTISHREFWPAILDHLAKAWGRDVHDLYRRLFDHHAGLPRGRVTHPKSGYVVIHGDDAPVPYWLVSVKQRFRLTAVALCFTEHEQMLGDDLVAVQEVFGKTLGLAKPGQSSG